jgi:hypothetical protein
MVVLWADPAKEKAFIVRRSRNRNPLKQSKMITEGVDGIVLIK